MKLKKCKKTFVSLEEDIENFVVKRDAGVARIAQMQKELRGTIVL